MIYLDYQATTPLAPEAFDAMLPWLRDQHANPHSAHRAGRAAKAAVEVARERVAALLPMGHEVAFTSGATEALNWAIKGTRGGIVTVATEHAAVLDSVAATGRAVRIVPVGADGLIDLDQACAAIGPGTGLVVAMLVNNEIGVIQPIAGIAALAHDVGALMLCDAVQGYGRVPIPDACDLVAISAHKIHGPKGIGALSIAPGVSLDPLLHGGGQERAGRSGTLSPALCAGFGVAAGLMVIQARSDQEHIEKLWQLAVDRLHLLFPGEGRGPVGKVSETAGDHMSPARGTWAPAFAGVQSSGWRINGSEHHRYHGNLNIRRDGLDVNRLMSDCRDIAFSAGSACASGSGRASHVLRAIGLTEAEARSSIRLGFGRYTTEAKLGEAIDAIAAAADAQRAFA